MKLLKVVKGCIAVPGLIGFVYDLVKAWEDGKIDKEEAKALAKQMAGVIGAVIDFK